MQHFCDLIQPILTSVCKDPKYMWTFIIKCVTTYNRLAKNESFTMLCLETWYKSWLLENLKWESGAEEIIWDFCVSVGRKIL